MECALYPSEVLTFLYSQKHSLNSLHYYYPSGLTGCEEVGTFSEKCFLCRNTFTLMLEPAGLWHVGLDRTLVECKVSLHPVRTWMGQTS